VIWVSPEGAVFLAVCEDVEKERVVAVHLSGLLEILDGLDGAADECGISAGVVELAKTWETHHIHVKDHALHAVGEKVDGDAGLLVEDLGAFGEVLDLVVEDVDDCLGQL